MKKTITYEQLLNTGVSKVGIYRETNKNYHDGPGISSSELKQLLKSGAHYQAYLQSPPEPSKEMSVGSLVHALLLEPETLEKEFHVGDFNTRRGKDFEAAVKEAGTRTLVSREEMAKALEIVEAFTQQAKDHPCLNGQQYNLLDGVKEHSFYWKDSTTGIQCKVKPDCITPSGVIVDIKTTRNAGFDAFQKSIVDYGYYLSAAYYLKGVQETLKQAPSPVVVTPPTHFAIIAIETEAPYAVQTYFFSAESLAIGIQHCDKALATLLQCVQTGKWTGYEAKMVEISLPNWFFYKMNKS